jgi:hypothetical protein
MNTSLPTPLLAERDCSCIGSGCTILFRGRLDIALAGSLRAARDRMPRNGNTVDINAVEVVLHSWVRA